MYLKGLNSWWVHHNPNSLAHGSWRKIFVKFNSDGSSVAMCPCSLTPNHTEVRFLRFTGNRGLVFGLVDISTVFADIPFTVAMNELLCLKNAAPISHCFSPHTSNWRLWQLKKIKSLGPFWSYQLNSTANPAHLPQFGPNWPNRQYYLAGSSKTTSRIFIFSIAMGGDYSFYAGLILCEIHCILV